MMRIVQGVFWWSVTIATLFVLDDLVFGPGYWMLALVDPLFSTVVAYVSSAVFQVWLINACLKVQPNRLATFFLKHLMLERKNVEVAKREQSVKRSATSIVGALLATPLLGATIPVLLLHKHRLMEKHTLQRFSLVLVAIYSAEFALIHGGYGFGALVRALFGA